MADARAKAVLDQLVDTWSRAAYIHDIMTQLDAPLGFGDVVEVPSIADLTVYANGASSQSAQSITTSVLTLTADQHPWIPAMLPKVAAAQLLDGAWAQQVAEAATVMLKSSIDQSIITYLRGVMIPGLTAAGSFVDNLASSGSTTPALSAVAIYNSVAALENQSGANRSRFAWVLNPFAQAEIASLAAFIPAYQNAEQGVLGVPAIGSLNGLPVYVSPNVPRRRTVASTAYSITSNVETVTVAAGHQILPGMAVTFDTVTAGGRLTTSAVVSSVTATTVVFPNTTANSSATEAGTITIEACENHLLDLGHHYVAQQQLPSVRVVPDLTTTGDVLQVSAIYGRVARSGRGRILLSRATAS
jgi:hypothetical protein